MSKPSGITVTWRAARRHWVGKYRRAAGDWPQKVVPTDIAKGPRDRAKALDWMAKYAANARPMKLSTKKRPTGVSLHEAFERWMQIRRNDERTSPATLRAHSDLFRNVVLSELQGRTALERIALGEEDVVSLGTDFRLLRRWIRAVSKVHSPGRVRAAYSKLSLFYDDAIVEGWFRGENPFRNAALVRELPALPTQRERGGIVFLPVDIANALLRSPRVPLARRARYALLVTSGLREGEVSGLTWRRVTLEGPSPRVEVVRARRLQRRKNEELGPLKRKTSEGVLPLHSATRAALVEWRDDDYGVSFLLGRPPRSTDPVFPSARARDRGGFARPATADHLRHDLQAAGLSPRDELGRPYTAHACRRTFGTTLKRVKVDEVTRQRLMRHGAQDVTAEFYTGDDWAEMVEAVESVPLTWVEGLPYEEPERRPRTHQERVLEFLAAHPQAKAPEVAEALELKRSTVAWVMSRIRTGRLVSPLVPHVVARGTKGVRKCPTLLEPRDGFEPTTCALRKRKGDVVPGVDRERNAARDASGVQQPNDANQQHDRPVDAKARSGTKIQVDRGSSRYRVELPDGRVVSTDLQPGEHVGKALDRLASELRRLGYDARRVGPSGLQIGGAS